MTERAELFLVGKDASIKQAMRQMSEIGQKSIFLINDKGKLVGALSDGDIRKWILKGRSLQETVYKVCNRNPRFVREDYHVSEVKELMLNLNIECVAVVGSNREVKEVLTWGNVFGGKVSKERKKLEIQVVIMAGGEGNRLDPFTKILPKPLIPIGDKPIIELIIDRFCEYGIKEFYISVNHKSNMIKSYFQDINDKYIIHYIEETKPLGTAGSLKLLENKGKGPLLVTNCDIIIESDYTDLVKFHNDNDYDMTLVVSYRHYVIPYGICEIENGGILSSIKEKPEYDLLVNTGMYVMKRRVLGLIPTNQFFDITDLIAKAKGKRYKIGVFPIGEKSWIDIGQWEQYRKAVERMRIH